MELKILALVEDLVYQNIAEIVENLFVLNAKQK